MRPQDSFSSHDVGAGPVARGRLLGDLGVVFVVVVHVVRRQGVLQAEELNRGAALECELGPEALEQIVEPVLRAVAVALSTDGR